MAISVIKAWDEGPIKLGGKSGSATVNWIASTDDPDNDTREDVIFAVYTYADPFYFDLTLDSVTLSERLSDNAGEAHWAVQVGYKSPENKKEKPLKPKAPGTDQPARWSIRSSGGATMTRTKSLELVDDTSSNILWRWDDDPTTNPLVLKLIGLEANPDGNSASNFGLTGVPVPVGKIELVLTTVRPNEDVKNNSYLINLAEHVAKQKVNDRVFLGFPKGSLQLTSLDASQRAKPENENEDPDINDQPWDVTLVMAYEPPVTVDTDTHPPFDRDKEGHEYLDITYVDQEVKTLPVEPNLTIVIPVIQRMAIHRLFEYLDFKTALGIS